MPTNIRSRYQDATREDRLTVARRALNVRIATSNGAPELDLPTRQTNYVYTGSNSFPIVGYIVALRTVHLDEAARILIAFETPNGLQQVQVSFPDNPQLPDERVIVEPNGNIIMYEPIQYYPYFLDLLRNEGPNRIYIEVTQGNQLRLSIHTGLEAIGEGDI